MFQLKNSKNRQIKTKNDSGFTLLELMTVVFVVAIGLLAVYAVSSNIIVYTNLSLSRLTASYLAQEGIEIVRNIRDTNWLETSDWTSGLAVGDWEADYNDGSLSNNLNRYLNIESASGFYGYGAGTQTKFKRKITITPDGEALKVSVLVQWQERGKSYEVTVQENLYGWYNP